MKKEELFIKKGETIKFPASKVNIEFGAKNTTWYRIKQIIRWIFTGRAQFDL